ncbi:MAG TPA: hypothetical protein VH583_11390 [Vicinamibacterales bacterium]|jgi:hypothetical protein
MEIADVRRAVHGAIERGRQESAQRRERQEQASRAFDAFLNHTCIPLMRQIANVLRAEGYPFGLATPAGSVKLSSDKSADNFIEVSLDTAGDAPRVVARTRYARGRRVVDAERVVASGDPEVLTDTDLLAFLTRELETLIER